MHQRFLRIAPRLPSFHSSILVPSVSVFHRSFASSNTKAYTNNPHSSLDIAFFEEHVQTKNNSTTSTGIASSSTKTTIVSITKIPFTMSTEVTAPVIIDGKATADAIRANLKEKVTTMIAKHGRAPGLAVVLVGERTDSATYVRMKKKACEEVGIIDVGRDLPGNATEAEIVAVVQELNQDPRVDGILVQLPLPSHVNENNVLDAISYDKDADGLHPLNAGYLALKGRKPLAVACTPKGCIELLKRYNIPIDGKRAVVLGRSNIVGVPVATLLQQENATVTVCHSRTPDIPSIVKEADIVVAAIGKPLFVKGEWLKPGAVVIDVGINSLPDSTKKTGYRLVGDVDYDSAVNSGNVKAITPVPGGVGPMTIAMLLENTIGLYQAHFAGDNSSSSSSNV